MILKNGFHLAYCTNVHPGETWEETFASLNRWTLAVKQQLDCVGAYAIGLRLSNQASLELAQREALLSFQRWLERNNCYVFTVNGFPYGRFHSARVKENVYLPDWTTPERVEYTRRLMDLLAQIMPEHIEGSISTLPGSFKEFIQSPEQEKVIRNNVWRCARRLAEIHDQTGRKLSLALEPEPCCLLENCEETLRFFERLRGEHPNDPSLDHYLGVNYDTCHFAVEFEEAHDAIGRLRDHGIRLSKIHLSNALRLGNTRAALAQLAALAEDVYLHQVIVRGRDGTLARFKDVDAALASPLAQASAAPAEWRVHFHIPLYSEPFSGFETTADHIRGVLKMLKSQPDLCHQFEIETYTWAVLPPSLKGQDLTEHITHEYKWTLQQMAEHGLT